MIVTFKRTINIVSEYSRSLTILAIIAQILAILEILTLSFIYPIFTQILGNSVNNTDTYHYKILSNFINEENYLNFSIIIAFFSSMSTIQNQNYSANS